MKQSFSGAQNASGIPNPITSYLNLAHYAVKVSERYKAIDERMREKDFPERMLAIMVKASPHLSGENGRGVRQDILEAFGSLPKSVDDICSISDPLALFPEISMQPYKVGSQYEVSTYLGHVCVPAIFEGASKRGLFSEGEREEIRDIVLYLDEKIVKSGKLVSIFQNGSMKYGKESMKFAVPEEKRIRKERGEYTGEDVKYALDMMQHEIFPSFYCKGNAASDQYHFLLHDPFPVWAQTAIILDGAAKKIAR
ncbi:Uncharacterised protein [uncultured archaeon]|nr:Uncharacterised protein [uncultured archaeon]